MFKTRLQGSILITNTQGHRRQKDALELPDIIDNHKQMY